MSTFGVQMYKNRRGTYESTSPSIRCVNKISSCHLLVRDVAGNTILNAFLFMYPIELSCRAYVDHKTSPTSPTHQWWQ